MPSMFVVTRHWLTAHATIYGGYTKAHLAALGEPWRPTKGWQARCIGKAITPEQQRAFESATRRTPRVGVRTVGGYGRHAPRLPRGV